MVAPDRWPYQVQPFLARVDRGAMAMKGCSAFPKAPASLEPYHQIVVIFRTLIVGGEYYPSAGVQSVYSTAPTDWENVEY